MANSFYSPNPSFPVGRWNRVPVAVTHRRASDAIAANGGNFMATKIRARRRPGGLRISYIRPSEPKHADNSVTPAREPNQALHCKRNWKKPQYRTAGAEAHAAAAGRSTALWAGGSCKDAMEFPRRAAGSGKKRARSTSASVRALDGSGSNDTGQTDSMPAASATSFDPGSTIHKRCGVAAAKNPAARWGAAIAPLRSSSGPVRHGLDVEERRANGFKSAAVFSDGIELTCRRRGLESLRACVAQNNFLKVGKDSVKQRKFFAIAAAADG